MRYRFVDSETAAEKKARARTLAAIRAWWKAFAARRADLDALFAGKKKWDLPALMDRTLGAVEPRLMWEFGRALSRKNQHRLVITVESELSLAPLRDLVLSMAPKVRGFELYPHRVPEPVAMLAPTIDARLQLPLPRMSIVVTQGEHATVDLRFLIEGCKGPNDADASAVAFVTSETLLGEDVLMRDIGVVEVAPLVKARGAVTIEGLRARVAKELAKRDARKPKGSANGTGAKYSLFRLEPAEDPRGQRDLYVAMTRRTDVFRATHCDLPFFSERFTRIGETFAYLKIDGAKGLQGSAFTDREDIENAVARALGPKLGAVIGGGTGIRYSYVELALRDVDAAIPKLRSALCEGKLPKRSWLLFHDATLALEWVPIYAGGAAPPR